MDNAEILVKEWLEHVVIGMNLCPFARKPFVNKQVKFVVDSSVDEEGVYESLVKELMILDSLPPEELETTLFVMPNLFEDFDCFLNGLAFANQLIVEYGWEGRFQIASFHPEYCFDGVSPDDAENYTNKAPFPIFHLIREASLEKVISQFPDTDKIPEYNINKMHSLSESELRQYFHWCFS